MILYVWIGISLSFWIVHGTEKCHRDIWGTCVEWYNKEDGWTQERRDNFLKVEKQIVAQSRLVPNFTQFGYRKMVAPRGLHEFILEQRRAFDLKNEICAPQSSIQNCDRVKDGMLEHKNNTKIMNVQEPNLLRSVINTALKPILEEWSRLQLEPTSVYGIRRYLRGSKLMMHVDRLNTHVISAILQIDQRVDQDWPLHVVDFDGVRRQIALKPGEMLLYESAKLPHGRPTEFNGTFFDNIFVHFKPEGEWFQDESITEIV